MAVRASDACVQAGLALLRDPQPASATPIRRPACGIAYRLNVTSPGGWGASAAPSGNRGCNRGVSGAGYETVAHQAIGLFPETLNG
jgi:hypothetical protein